MASSGSAKSAVSKEVHASEGSPVSRATLSQKRASTSVSPGSGWRWFKQAVNLGRSNPRAIFGAVALLAMLALVPSVIQLALQYGLGLGPEAVMTVVGVTTLVSIFVYPLLIGGLLRVIHAAERGEPTHAAAIFDTFRSGQGGGRLIGFGLAMAAILGYAAVTPGQLRTGIIITVAAALAGMALGRIISGLIDGPTSFYPNWFYCLVEAAAAGGMISVA